MRYMTATLQSGEHAVALGLELSILIGLFLTTCIFVLIGMSAFSIFQIVRRYKKKKSAKKPKDFVVVSQDSSS